MEKKIIDQNTIEKLLGERYTIEELAAGGGFGDVYRGYDSRMCRPVAVKVVRSLGDKEADVMIRLEHKGLPSLYDVIRGNDVTVMVMEWIPGVDLEKYIEKNGSLSEKSAAGIGRELLEILTFLHEHHPMIVYQDLKPSNIMLMPDGHIKLVDFGTALVMDYGDEEAILAGTVGYGAPEQRGITGIRHASAASDLYAWGAVMYSCLSGILLNKPPYTMKKIRTVVPGISYGMSSVITKCTRRNERDRFHDARSVSRHLVRGNLINAACKTLFSALFILCIVPFLWVWYRMYREGDFALMDRRFHTAIWLLKTGTEIKAANIARTLKYLLANDALAKNCGIMMLTAAWMFGGLKLIQNRKYIKLKRSIYLSSRKYPGLWIPTLIAGIVFGYGIGGNMSASVSMAEELDEEISPRAEALPINLVDEEGNKLLLKYGAPYEPDGDIRIQIGRDVFDECESGYLKIEYVPGNGGITKARKIPIE